MADGAGLVRLCHRGLGIQYPAQGGLHRLHGLREAADLIAAAHLHHVLQVAGGHRTCSGFHRQHRLHHARRSHQARPISSSTAASTVSAAHSSRVCRACCERDATAASATCVACVLSASSAIATGRSLPHQVVAGRGIVAGRGKCLQRRVIVLLQLRVQANERLRQLTRARVRAGGQTLASCSTRRPSLSKPSRWRWRSASSCPRSSTFFHSCTWPRNSRCRRSASRLCATSGGTSVDNFNQAEARPASAHSRTTAKPTETAPSSLDCRRGARRRIHREALSGRGNAVSTRYASAEVRRSIISVSFSDVKEVFHRTNVSIWNKYGPWTGDINVTNVVT